MPFCSHSVAVNKIGSIEVNATGISWFVGALSRICAMIWKAYGKKSTTSFCRIYVIHPLRSVVSIVL